MDDGEEDFVFYGTPIEREEDTSARKRKAVADAGQLRALAPWKQEVRDEEGRRRFHGAFTGGFSAGYYNTVGSKEGWTPQTFTSSRKNRAEVKKQSIYNFLDEEDVKDMGGHALETSMQFDTFGFTAAEFARKQAEEEQEKRPSAIPGPVPDEIVIPASNSIGTQLLLKMGWRYGHSIKKNNVESYEARREARRALLAFSGNEELPELKLKESTKSDSEEHAERMGDHIYSSKITPIYVLQPKLDLFGLGFDPYKHAPEFRDKKRSYESTNKNRDRKAGVSRKGNLLSSNSGKYAPGFGIGALEELDFEDEDIYAAGFEYEQTVVEEVEPLPSTKDSRHRQENRVGSLPGFKVASSSDYQLERFQPPVIPKNFEAYHKFPIRSETACSNNELPPPEVPPPEDNYSKVLIDGFATLVSRCGKVFEDLSREKNKSNPMFSFLTGGDGHDYYERKLWEEKQKNLTDLKLPGGLSSNSSIQGSAAGDRGRILGEKPLQRSSTGSTSSATSKEVLHFQSNLSETFTKQIPFVGSLQSAKPFQNDPAKQERFEQFLKDKYQGGLRSTQPSGTSVMSETDRARERLDFEAAAETIEKGSQKNQTHPPSTQQVSFMSGGWEQQFMSPVGTETHKVSEKNDKMASDMYPKREEFQWRPFPLLCKRFDLIDPFMGKPPSLPRARSRMETLFFTTEPTKSAQSVDAREQMLTSQSTFDKTEKQLEDKEHVIEQITMNVQRPVDLYKAIFSDDEDDEDEKEESFHHVADSEKKNEGANTTLNHLIAGDFLESIGKELGLEVPPDATVKCHTSNDTTATVNGSAESTIISRRNEKYTSVLPSKEIREHDKMGHEQRILEHGPSSTPPDKPEASLLGGKNCGSDWRDSHIRYGREIQGGYSHLEEDKVGKQDQVRNNEPYLNNRSSDTQDIHSSRDQYKSKKSRTHEKRFWRSQTPDAGTSSDECQARKVRVGSRHHQRSSMPLTDCFSDSEDRSRSKSRSKKHESRDRSARHSNHHKHKRKPHSSHDDDRNDSDDSAEATRSRNRKRHSVHSVG